VRRLANSEDRIDLGELIAFEIKVLFHPGDVRVGQIASIKL